MNKVNALIQKLCPTGVPFKSIEELIERAPKSTKGVGPISSMSEGPYVAFTTKTKTFMVNEYLVDGEYIFMNDGGQADTKYFNGKAYYSDHVFAFTSHKINVRFLYHYLLKLNDVINNDYFRGGGIKNLIKKEFLQIMIPVPPKEIQEEIIKILDSYSDLNNRLIDELDTEIALRKEQFRIYREKLINDCEGDIKTIDEVCDVFTGGEAPSNFSKEPDISRGLIYAIWANGRDVYGYTDTYKIESDAVCISSIGANTGAVFFHEGKFTPIIRLKVLIPKDLSSVNTRYLYHAVSIIDFTGRKKSSVPNMNANEVKAKLVKIPSKLNQDRIADLLDRYDELSNSMLASLPSEIDARQKQYAFYRDELLSFTELRNA